MTESQPVPQPQTPPPFPVGAFLGGLALSVMLGAVANIIAGLIGASTNLKVAAFFIGMVPGAIFVGLSRLPRNKGLALGLLIGGCVIALIGGACGAAITPLDFK